MPVLKIEVGLEENNGQLVLPLADGRLIPVQAILPNFSSFDIIKNLSLLREYGVEIEDIIHSLSVKDIIRHRDELEKHGASIIIDVQDHLDNMSSSEIRELLPFLLDQGYDVNDLVQQMDAKDIAESLITLLECNAWVEQIFEKLTSLQIIEHYHIFQSFDIDLDFHALFDDLTSEDIVEVIEILLLNGFSVEEIASRLSHEQIVDNFGRFFLS